MDVSEMPGTWRNQGLAFLFKLSKINIQNNQIDIDKTRYLAYNDNVRQMTT